MVTRQKILVIIKGEKRKYDILAMDAFVQEKEIIIMPIVITTADCRDTCHITHSFLIT